MSFTTTYEVYVQNGSDWTVSSVFDDRRQAVDEARSLVSRNRAPSVQVIEERFDAGSGQSLTAIVFRSDRDAEAAAPRSETTFRRRPQGKPAATPKPKRRKRRSGLFERLLLTLLLLGALAIGLLVAFAFVVDTLA